MNQVIVFEYEGGVAVMAAVTDIGLTILQIGQKDVPAGLPFWIVDASTITDDYVIDPILLGEPDGYGGTYVPE
ncbi:hypothetical protein [Kluyvera sichuanensis]